MLRAQRANIVRRQRRSGSSHRMRLGCTICMGMFGNGAPIPGIKIMRAHQRMEVYGSLVELLHSGCCAGVRGTTILKTAARPTVTGTNRTTGTTTTACEWLLVPRRELFDVRAGGWEFVGSTSEESRPAPVMGVTPSEYQPGSGGLVGGDAEASPDLFLKYLLFRVTICKYTSDRINL